MKDAYGRTIDYLRVSVTDFCNLRCRYCMPAEGVDKKNHSEILSFEEIASILEVFHELGIRKLRFTGGEPLVRRDFVQLVEYASRIGFDELAMTTNATLLGKYAEDLKRAGIGRVNISLDTLDPEKYRQITRGGDIRTVFEGIQAAQKVGIEPIKINVVLMKGFNETEVEDFLEWSRIGVEVRFIELMPLGESAQFKNSFLSGEELLQHLSGVSRIVFDGQKSVAQMYWSESHQVEFGLIQALSCKFCDQCNRIRMTPDGKLKLCLHSNEEWDIRKALQEQADLKQWIQDAILSKPKEHLLEDGAYCHRTMNAIGG